MTESLISTDYQNLTLDQDLELVMFDIATIEVNFERQKEGEQELVVFIQSSTGVTECFKCQVFNDVVYPFGVDR